MYAGAADAPSVPQYPQACCCSPSKGSCVHPLTTMAINVSRYLYSHKKVVIGGLLLWLKFGISPHCQITAHYLWVVFYSWLYLIHHSIVPLIDHLPPYSCSALWDLCCLVLAKILFNFTWRITEFVIVLRYHHKKKLKQQSSVNQILNFNLENGFLFNWLRSPHWFCWLDHNWCWWCSWSSQSILFS